MRGQTRAGGGLPPEVATDFDFITIGRSIVGGSPPGGRRAADDGSPDEEPIVDAVDASVNAASSSVGVHIKTVPVHDAAG